MTRREEGPNIRANQISKFLASAGWGNAIIEPFPGDASTRQYARLTRAGEVAILMDAPPSEGGSDYARIAKLADGEMAAFTSIGQALTMRGFSAPKILAADIKAGLLLLEDLGADLVASLLKTHPDREAEIYKACMETLGAVYRSSFSPTPSAFGHSWLLRKYDQAALIAETELMPQWYLPFIGKALSPEQLVQWRALWTDALSVLEAHAPGLVLRDFHAENIFWLPKRIGTGRIGLIDFQDGLMGHPAYDVVSLIEDARRDVDPALAPDLINHFCRAAKITNDEAFQAAYAVLGAQRNAKILGIFVRLAKRDAKHHYLDLLPRVQAHFAKNLTHPALAKISTFLETLS